VQSPGLPDYTVILFASAAHVKPYFTLLSLKCYCPSAAHCVMVCNMTDQAVRNYLSQLGRRGAKVTNEKLTPAQRKASARKAARARWKKAKESINEKNVLGINCKPA
jgi:hypothetical protein